MPCRIIWQISVQIILKVTHENPLSEIDVLFMLNLHAKN